MERRRAVPPSNHREGTWHRGRGTDHTQRENRRQPGTEEEPGQGRALWEDGGEGGAGGMSGWRAEPEKRARKPCVRELMTSISCRDTVCTTSLRFWSSPSGHCTNLVYGAARGWRQGREEHEGAHRGSVSGRSGLPRKGLGIQTGVTRKPQAQKVAESPEGTGVPGDPGNREHSARLRGPSQRVQGIARSTRDRGLGDGRIQGNMLVPGGRVPRAPEHLGAHGVVVARACEGAPQLGDLAGGLVDGDHIPAGEGGRSEEREVPELPDPERGAACRCSPGLDLVLGQGLNHLGAQVVYRLHLGRLEGQLAHLGALRRRHAGKGSERPLRLSHTTWERAAGELG